MLSQLAAALSRRGPSSGGACAVPPLALRTEIELIRENLERFIPGYAELADRMRDRPVAAVLHARQPTLAADLRDSLRADLVAMPGDVLKAVIAFYTLDAEINQFLDTLMQPAFLDRPVEQRIEILEVYADLFDAAVTRARNAEAELRLLAWASTPWWSAGRRRYRRTASAAWRRSTPTGGLIGPCISALLSHP